MDNLSHLVVGYCWDWNSKKNPKAMDIVMDEHDYQHQWNLSVDGSLWILAPYSIVQIGCIHTCQGLVLNYVGVIIGDDLVVRDGVVMVDLSIQSNMDASIQGYKKMLNEDA